jgi:hypothetical protein
MAENKLNIDGLRQEICEPVRAFAEKLINELGEALESITIVGSSLTEDFKPGQSDINSVLVLGKQNLDSLNTLAAMAKTMSKKRLAAPLLMTPDYIERSRDVFGIEFLDLQLIHKTIYGADPFSELTFAKSDVRLQCERELKATLIRLRQGYIAAAANKKLVRDILASAAGALVPLLRAILWLKDIDRPQLAEAALNKAAEQFEIKTDSLSAARRWRYEKRRPQESEIATAFEEIYKTVEQLADTVDKLEV